SDQLHALPTGQLEQVLLEVESIAIAEPKAVWEDLKLAPLVRHMKQVAVVTDLEWYGRLSRAFGAVWPGLEIAHFEPFDRESAVDWLATFDD
ncbi:MAG: STAS/SEC14 domain-containing protein, partial [Microlunatus sp.]|nr:STAS/SEC14 domain-containing protein [Microlunatus sp.]